MGELLLALTMLCTKTNDLNMWVIDGRKKCVIELLECPIKYNKTRESWIKCLKSTLIKYED